MNWNHKLVYISKILNKMEKMSLLLSHHLAFGTSRVDVLVCQKVGTKIL